jgi:hypothetical protein
LSSEKPDKIYFFAKIAAFGTSAPLKAQKRGFSGKKNGKISLTWS